MLTSAIRFNNLGISVVPCYRHSKMFDSEALEDRGYVLRDLKSSLPSVADLEHWFEDGRRNMAIVTGKVVVIDFDSRVVYNNFKRNWPTLAHTMTVATKRGYHCYYELSETLSESVKSTWPGVEIKYNGLCILAPPSVHPAGWEYELIGNGLLSRFAMLRLTRLDVLPFVTSEPSAPARPSGLQTGEKENSAPIPSFTSAARSRSDRAATEGRGVSISQYLTDLGHTLKPTSEHSYITNCPFHNDNHPSFWVNTKSGICNCYKPSCASDKPMDVFNLHARINNISNSEALKELRPIVKKKGKTRANRRKEKLKEVENRAFELMARNKK